MEIVDFTSGDMNEEDSEKVFTFPEFVNPLESLRKKAGTLSGRAQEAVAKVAHKARDGAQKLSLDGMQDRDPYMVTAEEKESKKQGGFGELSEALRGARTAPVDADKAREDDGALARERARHKAELKGAKEAALQQARSMEQSGMVEAKMLRERLAEAAAEIAALKKRAERAERAAEDALSRGAKASEGASKTRDEAQLFQAELLKLREERAAERSELDEEISRLAEIAQRLESADTEKGALSSQLAQLKKERDAAIFSSEQAQQELSASRKSAQKRDVELARMAKSSASSAAQLEKSAQRARVAEHDLARLRNAQVERPKPAPLEVVQVVSRVEEDRLRDECSRLRELELPALRKECNDAERRASEARRQCSVLEATNSEALAETAALRRGLASTEARLASLEQDREELRAQLKDARAKRDLLVDSADFKIHEAHLAADGKAGAARRQVAALDVALDAAQAEMAAAGARAAAELGDVESALSTAREENKGLTEALKNARGQRAFYFSGDLRKELRRLETTNSDLLNRTTDDPAPRREEEVSPALQLFEEAEHPHEEEEEQSPRTRLEYVASVLLRLARPSGEKALSVNEVAPMMRSLLHVPHADVKGWLTQLESGRFVGKESLSSLLLLVLDALRSEDAQLMELQASIKKKERQSAAALTDLAEAKSTSSAFEDSLKVRTEALERATENAAALTAEAAHLREKAVEAALLLTSSTEEEASLRHARQCVLAIVEAGRGSPTYNRLLPVVRALIKQSHNVTQRNLDALCATGSGAKGFLEPLFGDLK